MGGTGSNYLALSTPPHARPLDTPAFAEALARTLRDQHNAQFAHSDCSKSKALASADKPVNANQHSAALRSRSPPLATCHLARAIFCSEALRCLRRCCGRTRCRKYPGSVSASLIEPLKPKPKATSASKQQADSAHVSMQLHKKCLLLHHVTATTKTPALYTLCSLPVPLSTCTFHKNTARFPETDQWRQARARAWASGVK
jgi:hypothetical protein